MILSGPAARTQKPASVIPKHLALFGDSYMANYGGFKATVPAGMGALSYTDYATGGQPVSHVLSTQIPAAIAATVKHDAFLFIVSGNGTTNPYTEAELTTVLTDTELVLRWFKSLGWQGVVTTHVPVESGRSDADLTRLKISVFQLCERYGFLFADVSAAMTVSYQVTGNLASGDMGDAGHPNQKAMALGGNRIAAVWNRGYSDNPFPITCRADNTPSSTKRHANAIPNGLFMDGAGAFSNANWSLSGCTLTAGTDDPAVRGKVAKIAKSATGAGKYIECGGLRFDATDGVVANKYVYCGIWMRSLLGSNCLNHSVSIRVITNGGMTAPAFVFGASPLTVDTNWRLHQSIFPVPSGYDGAANRELYFRVVIDPGAVDATADICEVAQATIRELRLPYTL